MPSSGPAPGRHWSGPGRPAVPPERSGFDHTVVEQVDLALGRFLDTTGTQLRTAGPELEPVVAAVRELVFAGGKRIRPLFAYWGWRCVNPAGADDEGAVFEVAGALELLHTAALVHDDLIDESETRRGRPAAHARMATLHRDAAWSGSAPGFGAAAAILIGDLLLSWSSAMLADADLPVDRRAGVRRAFDLMSTEMMAGQYLDVQAQARGEHSIETALRVARFKSSKYTVERPLHLGAAAPGAPADVFAALSAFGVPVGEAFQLRDDVLGVFGDPLQTGKPAGDDLREGKRTVLVALAWNAGTATQRATLDETLGASDLDENGVARLRGIIVDTGALSAVERLISERAGQGEAALAGAHIRPDARAALRNLSSAALERQS